MRKNILFIEESLDPTTGGVQRVTWTIANYLEQNNYNVFYLFCKIDYTKIEVHKKIKLDFWTDDLESFTQSLNSFIKLNNISIIIDQDYSTPAIQIALKAQISKHKIKLIYCYHRNPYYTDFICNNNTKFLIAKNWIKRCLGINIYRPEFAMMCELSDKYVLLSKTYVNQFYRRYLVDKSKLTCLLNPSPFNDIVKENTIPKEKIVFIVTRFDERIKNIKESLDIWKKIEERGCNGWKLVIAGYGPDEIHIREYAMKLHLRKCEIVGKIDNPSDYYRSASIYMMTSKCEGYPMTLIEAMHYGCVPIAFENFISVRDIIDNDKNGIIIPKRRKNLYIKKMYKLMNVSSYRQKLSLNALESTKRNDINVVGQKWISLLESL